MILLLLFEHVKTTSIQLGYLLQHAAFFLSSKQLLIGIGLFCNLKC